MTAAASLTEEPETAPAPRARRDLEITEPAHDGGRFIVHDPLAGRYLQLGRTAVAVLHALDGRRTLTDIASEIGASTEQLAEAVAVFREHGLVEAPAGEAPAPAPGREGFVNELDAPQRSRVRRTGLLSVQIDLLDPSRVLARHGRLARALTGPAFWAAAAAALVLGALAAAAQSGRIAHVLSSPLPTGPAIIALLAIFPTIAAHEFAHASVAWRQGARARRMGVMLLYLVPSMFCDVSDCWRLPRRSDRVKVAGAGIALQIIAAALAFAVSLVPGLPPAIVTALLLYGAANALLAAVNLLPLVRLDGYLMLMSALDVSNLRAKAIADARAVTGRVVLGLPPREPLLRRRGPAIAFGVACAIAPLAIGLYGLTRVHTLLVPFGAFGAFAWLLGLGLLAVALVRRGTRALRAFAGAFDSPARGATANARRSSVPRAGAEGASGAPVPGVGAEAAAGGGPAASRRQGALMAARGALAVAALAVLLAVAGTSITRPRTIAGAFTTQGGVVHLLVDPGVAHSVVPGERVLLREPGLFASTTVGEATVLPGRRSVVPAAPTPSPIEGFGGVAERVSLPLRVDWTHGPASGTAVVQTGHQSLLAALQETYLTSSFATPTSMMSTIATSDAAATLRPGDDWGPVWLPMTSMAQFARSGRTIVRGEGCHVYDEDGRRYLGATSGLWNVNCGWGEERIVEAITEQLRTLSYGTLFRYGNDVAVELANRLLDIAPAPFEKVFYTCSGSTAVETALKAARRHQRLIGHPEREIVVGLRGSYHGTMYGSMALTGDDLEQDEYGVDRRHVRHVAPGIEGRCPHCGGDCEAEGCEGELAHLFAAEGDRIAAVVLEPVLGSGGYAVTPAFAARAAQLCADHGALLVIDEVATGFGRTGRWFATEHLGVSPDVLILSKAINSGYLPLAATLFAAPVVASFASSGAVFAHGETQSGNPAACAAALATIDVMEDDDLVVRGAAMGALLRAGVERLADEGLGVRAVRGRGLMLGVELAGADGAPMRPLEVMATVEALLGEGVIVHPGPGGIGLLPPLTIATDEVDTLVGALRRVLGGGRS